MAAKLAATRVESKAGCLDAKWVVYSVFQLVWILVVKSVDLSVSHIL